jgi:hypothetical protein
MCTGASQRAMSFLHASALAAPAPAPANCVETFENRLRNLNAASSVG